MTLAYVCIVVACLLPIWAAGMAKSGSFTVPKSQGGFDNHYPREWLARQTGRRARANAAQANSFEALPLFIAAVLVAHQTGAAQGWVDALAVVFIVMRVAYILCYVWDRPAARSIAWTGGMAASLALFFSSYF